MNWISVNDRLPENETEVLLFGEISIEVDSGLYHTLNKRFIGTFIAFYKNYVSIEGEVISVTHWMPLPDPPISP